MGEKCCSNCFGDHQLTQIIRSKSQSNETCGFCGAQDGLSIDPVELQDDFENLLAAYEVDETGTELAVCLNRDWGLFNDGIVLDTATKLLAYVLDDNSLVRKKFKAKEPAVREGLGHLASIKEELRTRNRYFPETKIEERRLEQCLVLTNNDDQPKTWFRARIASGLEKLKKKDMGAPPADKVSNGRANPPGIPYLYLASDRDTAISEVRPQPGARVYTMRFELAANLTLADLRSPRRNISPFGIAEPANIAQLLADIPFVEDLGHELYQPVLQDTAAIDYTPTQYCCELIKKLGFDGVIYNSSSNEGGFNLAIFTTTNAISKGSIKEHFIEKVSVQHCER